MEVIVRRQDWERCASITCMIRHYVARRVNAIEDHPHNADVSELRLHILMQGSASPFLISNAARGTCLTIGTRPLDGPDRRIFARVVIGCWGDRRYRSS